MRTADPAAGCAGKLNPARPAFEYWQLWDTLLAAAGGHRPGPELAAELDADLRVADDATARHRLAGNTGAALLAAVNAGLASLYAGRADAAAQLAATVAAARESGARWEEGYGAFALGTLHRLGGEPGPALAWLSVAERAFEADSQAYGHTRLAMGAALATISARQARPHLRAALDAFRATGARWGKRAALSALSAVDHRPARTRALTHREHEVAGLIAGGLTNRQIAARLAIAERTVDTHVQRILAKLGCATRVQVAVLVSGGT